MHVEQFTYGAVTPALAFAMSYLGCLLGLMCATRSRLYRGVGRVAWIVAASLSLGGTGIWVMHFIAMLGFSVPGIEIRYDLPMTGLSAAIAVVAVGAGQVCAGDRPGRVWRLLLGGLLTGLAVAGMHYLGMAAMVMPAKMSYNPVLVAISVVIAVIAATVALWFTMVIKSRLTSLVAALVMAIAVTGMHFTGMAAVRISHPTGTTVTSGTPVSQFLLPLGLVVGSMTVALCLLVPFAVSPTDVKADAELEKRIEAARRRSRSSGRSLPEPAPAAAPFIAQQGSNRTTAADAFPQSRDTR